MDKDIEKYLEEDLEKIASGNLEEIEIPEEDMEYLEKLAAGWGEMISKAFGGKGILKAFQTKGLRKAFSEDVAPAMKEMWKSMSGGQKAAVIGAGTAAATLPVAGGFMAGRMSKQAAEGFSHAGAAYGFYGGGGLPGAIMGARNPELAKKSAGRAMMGAGIGAGLGAGTGFVLGRILKPKMFGNRAGLVGAGIGLGLGAGLGAVGGFWSKMLGSQKNASEISYFRYHR